MIHRIVIRNKERAIETETDPLIDKYNNLIVYGQRIKYIIKEWEYIEEEREEDQ
jgi:cyanate lyase